MTETARVRVMADPARMCRMPIMAISRVTSRPPESGIAPRASRPNTAALDDPICYFITLTPSSSLPGTSHMRNRLLLLAAASGSALIAAGSAGADAAPSENTVAEVVVTAAPYPVSLDSVTTSVNIVGQEQLDRAPPGGPGDGLNGLPGVRSTFFGPRSEE